MFAKILIANRGEIACRIIRTAKAMGIGTVAVYSEADARARHVELADEAVAIGPAPAAESYLAIDNIVGAAVATGAAAVHPGYGFLAENANFVQALEEVSVTFIGPGAEAIAAMGDKLEAKRIATDAGVNVIPGHAEPINDADRAVRIAQEVGYPVMLKAAAGGGGKGMRLAGDDEAVHEGFARAESEARASFGDGRIFIERYVPEPRHIEIQILADGHGNAIHLGERECSIQRRHQKIIEEAPSPLLDAETRAAMGAQALALVRAVSYRSAGTVEFIVDATRNFYFLEMNTRLQVEHPVTELTTGVDLVAEMIRIAAGEPLGLRQEDVAARGWAVEARVYAEDPDRGFLPSTGRLRRYRPPTGEGLRLDSGVAEGDEITVFYDPMIAKLCAHGADRDEAIARLRAGLDRFYIRGIDHNIRFLNLVLGHPRFGEGRTNTDFIAHNLPDGTTVAGGVRDDAAAAKLIAIAAFIHGREAARALGRPACAAEWVAMAQDRAYPVATRPNGAGGVISVDGTEMAIESDWAPGAPLFTGTVDGVDLTVQIHRLAVGYRLSNGGFAIDLAVHHPRTAELAQLMPHKAPPDTSKFLLSPMPGLVVALAVDEGDEVKAGQPLAVVDAMKMENVLRAEHDGTIARICADRGVSVAVDEVILEFE